MERKQHGINYYQTQTHSQKNRLGVVFGGHWHFHKLKMNEDTPLWEGLMDVLYKKQVKWLAQTSEWLKLKKMVIKIPKMCYSTVTFKPLY